MQQQRGLRGFVQTPLGRVGLLAFAILATFGTYVYVSTLLAIPVMLLVGLGLPIYLGLKRIRFLALVGLVILLALAPIATLVITQDVRAPIPAASSPTNLGGSSGSVMQNAQVTPFVGSTSTNFTWSVTLYPKFIPHGNSSTNALVDLFVSTCPGATGNSSPNCAAGYPLHIYTMFSGNLTANATVQFHHTIGTDGIWAWQIGMYLRNTTFPSQNPTFILLVGDQVYNGLEGPVVGTYWTIYGILILTVYLNGFVYLGIPFYVVLLVYAYIKRRQLQRGDASRRAPGPTPTDAPSGGTPPAASIYRPPGATRPTSGATTGPRRPELSCPNCNAVVYANETTCWKCGATLPTGAAAETSAPLPSNPPKPP